MWDCVRVAGAAATAVTVLALLTACSSGDGTSDTPRPADGERTAPSSATASATAGATSSPPASATAGAAAPRFEWTVRRATRASLGGSWRRGCPVDPSKLRVVRLTHWHFDGTVRDGVIVLHQDVVGRVRDVFATMYERRFPLRSVRPVTDYGSDDDRSMAADNTSAFNCRRAVASGPPTWSRHAYGKAIDVNPVENPYVFRGRVLPPAGKPYVNRRRNRAGMIRKGDPVHEAFSVAGFRWGGTFSDPDYQHFDR